MKRIAQSILEYTVILAAIIAAIIIGARVIGGRVGGQYNEAAGVIESSSNDFGTAFNGVAVGGTTGDTGGTTGDTGGTSGGSIL